MMQAAALLILIVASLYLGGVGALMLYRPRTFLHLLGQTAANWRVNVVEQGLRCAAGAALIVRAEQSKLPGLFETGGWFIVVSSLALLALPLEWHARYANWWARRLKPAAVRAIGPASVAFGGSLAYTAW